MSKVSGGTSEWATLLRDAEREKKVVIYGPPGVEYREALTGAFSKEFPNVHLDFVALNSAEAGPRILAEQQGGTFNADVFVTGTTTPPHVLLPAGALEPIKEWLVLPEVLDTSKWYEGQHHYADNEGQYTFAFEASVSSILTYNTQLVNPDEFQSYRDLLNPKWQGKIVGWDPRRPGPSSFPLRFWYHNPELGPQFIRDLYTVQSPVVSTDSRQHVDWVVQGRYPVGVFVSGYDQARDQGLPIDSLRRPMQEGAAMGTRWGSISRLKNAPHPSAAKLYVNWLLSPKGQVVWQEVTRQNSLRIDIPKEKKLLDEGVVPQPGVKYVLVTQPKYNNDQAANAEIRRIVTEALAGQ